MIVDLGKMPGAKRPSDIVCLVKDNARSLNMVEKRIHQIYRHFEKNAELKPLIHYCQKIFS